MNIDLKTVMREAFGKCPKCGTRLLTGDWLKWCNKRGCRWWALK